MPAADSRVDAFLGKAQKWRDEFTRLRKIARDCDLTEDFKWGKPCYTFHNSNVVLIHGFKAYCALLFFKGALLKDTRGILVAQSENTQATRQLRFTSAREIAEMERVIRDYIRQATAVEKAGLKVDFKKTDDFPMPEEFQVHLERRPDLKAAFEALTPGRQRAYLLYFSGARQSKTRTSRVEKSIPQILDGKGLGD